MAQYVYLLQEQELSGGPTGLYKIGKTTQDSIEARTKQYKAGNARPVVEYHSAIVHDCQEVETALHRQYKQFRLKAGGGDEWFQLSSNNLAAVVRSMDSYAIGQRKNNRGGSYVNPAKVFKETYQRPQRGVFTTQPRGSSGIPAAVWWVLGIFGLFWVMSARAGSADITIGQEYRLEQDAYAGCPEKLQPCNGGNVWSDNYQVIAKYRNGAKAVVTGRPQDPQYTEVQFTSGIRGWVYTRSLKRVAE